MKYYLLDTNFTIVHGIELYSSMIWTGRYNEPGDFELYTVATPESMELFKTAAKEHYYIVRADDDLSSMRGMIVTNIDTELQRDGEDHIIVTGKDLKYLLHRRIIIGTVTIAGEIETEIRNLVESNAINPDDPNRVIPYLELGPVAGITDVVNANLQGNNLDDAIKTICQLQKVGWDIRFDYNRKRFVFTMFKGVDRSYSQEEPDYAKRNPYVVFSADYDNLLKSKFTYKSDDYRNVAYVEAKHVEFDETKKENVIVDDTRVVSPIKMDRRAAGLDRYEMYVDGSSVDSQYAAEGNLYRYLLDTKGREELKKYDLTNELSGEVVPNLTFQLNKDYFLGDLVTAVNAYGQRFDARVTEVIETENTSKNQCIPKFVIENWDGKAEDEDKTLKSEEIRCTEDGQTRIAESGQIRRLSLGYEYADRCTEDGSTRVMENGSTRSSVKSEFIKYD